MRNFLTETVRNFLRVFIGRNLFWHLLAIALTCAIVLSGLDWKYLLATQGIYRYFFPAVIIGGLLPILLPAGLLVYGWLRKRPEAFTVAFMLIQAAILGSIVSSLYKAFTGRVQPNLHDLAVDISHGFQFGFLRHGIFWGWPSSHTTIAFSMAVALAVRFREKRALVICAILYALYVGIGVSMSIHWLSDAVAGVIIGSVIGWEVGNSARRNVTR